MRDDPGQLLLLGLPGPRLDSETARVLRRVRPGGYILFGRNIESASQVRALLDDLREIEGADPPPILTIDQEGGRVSRLRLIGSEPPSASQIAACPDAAGLARRHGDLTARLLRLFGFNLDLCPVLDLSRGNDEDNSLRGRCYGSDPAAVIALAGEFNRALRSGGVASCGKHFPGYSFAAVDPHHHLPTIDRSREEMERWELAVFRALRDELDSYMVAHAFYPGLDPARVPSSLSPAVVDGLLRREIGFDGVVMTDDLDMGAIIEEAGFDEALRFGLAAGNDLLMICHRTEMGERAREVLAGCPRPQIERALARLAAFRGRLRAPVDPFTEEAHREIDAGIWRLRVDALGEEGARARSVEDGKRSPVERY